MSELLKIAVALLILGAVFWLIESFFPSRLSQRKWRKGITIDLSYWFFTPLVTKTISRVAIVVLLLPAIFILGKEAVQNAALQGHGPIVQWPVWLQVFAAIVMADFIGYWIHRIFHGERLWTFHAVHHSSTELDWLSSVRVHPVNDLLVRIAQAIPILLFGFPAKILAVYIPFTTFYAILLHANVSWTFGPLKRVFASPVFHRWHHSNELEAQDKNFAGFFPVWDLLFGTFYMPDGKQPESFGIIGNNLPTGFLAQLVYPFQSESRMKQI
ncbi:sterol desaturase family protein [bacterium]|nr:sterol desaturase family protein [bacterium]MCI0613472.1 sterol desaturase family protein [bacterium]